MIGARLQAIKIMNAQAATGAAAAHEVNGDQLGIYIQIATTATVKIETSPDGVTWFDTSITGRTTSGYVALNELHRFIRANVTAWTAGTVNVWVVQEV